jgi:hypothetical protein
MQRTGSMSMKTPQGEMQADVVAVTQYPSSQRVVMNMPMGQITRVITPTAAWMVTPMGTQDIPSSQRDSSLGEMRADLITVLKNINNPKYTFTATGTEKVGDVNARIVEVNADGTNVKWYVDPSSGKLLRTISRGGAQMPGDVITDNVEWKTFDGLNLPVTAVITRNGEKAGEMKATMIQVNPTVEAGSFDKPAAK